jgi:hypothetical protein
MKKKNRHEKTKTRKMWRKIEQTKIMIKKGGGSLRGLKHSCEKTEKKL